MNQIAPKQKSALEAFEWRTDVTADSAAQVEALTRNCRVFNEEEIKVAAEMAQERLANPDCGYEFLFAFREGVLAAYTCYGPTSFTDNRYDLYWIAVDPAAQGAGLGAAILRKTEDLIRKCGGKAIYAETASLPDYEPARRFYLSNDYVIVAELPDFYWDGNAKIIYSKML